MVERGRDHELLFQMARAALSLTPAQAVIDLSELAVMSGKKLWGWYSELGEEGQRETLQRSSVASPNEVQQVVQEATDDLRRTGTAVDAADRDLVASWLQAAPQQLHEQTLSAFNLDGSGGTRTVTYFKSEEDMRYLYPKRLPQMKRGDRIPDTLFVCEESLGMGAFGEVWLGKHQDLPESYAFKVCMKEKVAEALQAEKQVLVELRSKLGTHENIVTLHDYRLDGDLPWLKFELVKGNGTLSHWLLGFEDGASEDKSLHIMRGVASGLAHAHRCGIVHADIKPSNILIDSGGRPKITDFGVGRILGANRTEGATGSDTGSSSSRGGTQLYMSPERLRGSEATEADDIYALGVVWYQMLVGNPRVRATGNIAGDLKRRHVSRTTIQTILKCLETSRERRFRDGSELYAHLARCENQSRWARWGFRGALILLSAIIMGLTAYQGITMVLPLLGYGGDTDQQTKDTQSVQEPESGTVQTIHGPRLLVIVPFSYADAVKTELPAGSLEYLIKRALALRYPSATILGHSGTYSSGAEAPADVSHGIGRTPDFSITGQVSCTDGTCSELRLQLSLATVEADGASSASQKSASFAVADLFLGSSQATLENGHPGGIRPLIDWLAREMGGMPAKNASSFLISPTTVRGALEEFIVGDSFWRQLDSGKARKHLEAACHLDKDFIQAYLSWAEALAFDSEVDTAKMGILHVTELLKNDAPADGALKKALTFEERKRYEALVARHVNHDLSQELRVLDKLAMTLAYQPEAQYEIAEAYFHSGNCKKALRYYAKATRLNPNFYPAYNHEAYCHAYKGEFSDAMDSMQRYLETVPEEGKGNALDTLGDVYYLKGDYSLALEKKKEATYPKGGHIAVSVSREFSIAKVLFAMGRDEEARALLEPGDENRAERHAQYPMSVFMLAWLQYTRGNLEAADLKLTQMIEMIPSPREDENDRVELEWNGKTYVVSRHVFLAERWVLPIWLKGQICHDRGQKEELLKIRRFMYVEVRLPFGLDGYGFYRPVTKYHRHLRTLGRELDGTLKESLNSLERESALLEDTTDKLGYWTTLFDRAFFLTDYAQIAVRTGHLGLAEELVEQAIAYNPHCVPAQLLEIEVQLLRNDASACNIERIRNIETELNEWHSEKQGHLWKSFLELQTKFCSACPQDCSQTN